MRFRDIQQALDVRSDTERIAYLERVIPRLYGPELRSALIALANLYDLHKRYRKAGDLYALVGMHEEAARARARI